MPARNFIVQHESTEVQGDGSWIKLRVTKYGEGKKLRKELMPIQDRIAAIDAKLSNGAKETERKKLGDEKAELQGQIEAMNERLLVEKIYDWNWVDEDGNPLPTPKNDPSVLEDLTSGELEFIQKKMRGSEDERKKPDSSS